MSYFNNSVSKGTWENRKLSYTRGPLLPINLVIQFELHEDNEGTNLRKGKNTKIVWRNTKNFQKSVFHKGIKFWNKLDEKIQKCPSIWSFKSNIKKLFVDMDEEMTV